MMKRAITFGICFVCLILIISNCVALANNNAITYAVVNNPDAADRLNIRIAPSIDAESLGKYYNGVIVQVLEDLNDEWVRVRIGNGGFIEGYMMKKYLKYDTDETVVSAMPTYISLSSAWELYRSMDISGDYVMHGNGEIVNLLGFSSKWWHIRVGEDTGFVIAGDASLEQLTGNYYDGYATAQINNPNPNERLNLRAEKSIKSMSRGKYYNGCIVAIIEKDDDGWCKVRIGNLDGYMKSEYLDFSLSTKELISTLPEVIIRNPNGKGANLRKEASTVADVISLYSNGTKVQVLGLTETWCHVQINGVTGFIMTKFLDPQLSYTSDSVCVDDDNQNENMGLQSSAWNGPLGYHTTAEWTIEIDEYIGIVSNPDTTDRLNLRVEPNSNSKSLGKYYNGVRVIINGDISGAWTEVAIGNLTGYMKTEYLKTDGSTVKSAMPVLRVNNPNPSHNLHLRKEQTTASESLGLYSNGTDVILMGFNDKWAHVIVDGQMGFMLAKYLE